MPFCCKNQSFPFFENIKLKPFPNLSSYEIILDYAGYYDKQQIVHHKKLECFIVTSKQLCEKFEIKGKPDNSRTILRYQSCSKICYCRAVCFPILPSLLFWKIYQFRLGTVRCERVYKEEFVFLYFGYQRVEQQISKWVWVSLADCMSRAEKKVRKIITQERLGFIKLAQCHQNL